MSHILNFKAGNVTFNGIKVNGHINMVHQQKVYDINILIDQTFNQVKEHSKND